MNLVVRKNTAPSHGAERPFFDLHREIDNIFGSVFGHFDLAPFKETAGGQAALLPRLDIAETGTEYVVSAELPGVDEKHIDVQLEKGVLTIQGEKTSETEEKGKKFHRVERSYGAFKRVVSLPQDADPEKVTARVKHGVLTVTVAKIATPQNQSRKIAVQSA